MVIGLLRRMPANGSLTKTCRREGTIDTCSPSIAPTGADHALPPGRIGESVGHLVRPCEPVARTESRSVEIVRFESRYHGACFGWFELDNIVEATGALQLERVAEARALVLGGQQEQIADRPEIRGLPGLLDEARQEAFCFHADPDVDFGGELRPDPTRAGGGRALPDPTAVDHNHAPAR